MGADKGEGPKRLGLNEVEGTLRAGFKESGEGEEGSFLEQKLGFNKYFMLAAIDRGEFDFTAVLGGAAVLVEHMPEDWLRAAVEKWSSPERILEVGLKMDVATMEKMKNGLARLSVGRRKILGNMIGRNWSAREIEELGEMLKNNTDKIVIGEKQLRECLVLLGLVDGLVEGMVGASDKEAVDKVKNAIDSGFDSVIFLSSS